MGQMPTLLEHEAVGREIVLYGRLLDLRQRLDLTRSAMAELLLMSQVTYNRLEAEPEYAGRMWKSTAEKLGRFVWLAWLTIDRLQDDGIDISTLMPMSTVAVLAGLPQELLLKWHRTGAILAEDLGILGLWVHRDELHLIWEAV